MMGKKVLLLGHTGKMGIALREVFAEDYCVIGKNSRDFDALDFAQIRNLIEENSPDIVINTVAYLGIEPCEQEPEKAFRLNALCPRFLSELSNEKGFLLVHFSTDAVFDDEKHDFYVETDQAHPLNIYGFTKYGGDCFVQAIAKNYYLFRISVLFGQALKCTQFVEKMLERVNKGAKLLKVSSDIVLSPTYSKDVALEIKRILQRSAPFGLYHIANDGKASLYQLFREIAQNLNLDIELKRASYKDFPFLGRKNTYTPLKSEKIASLRPWQEAVKDYCRTIKTGGSIYGR